MSFSALKVLFFIMAYASLMKMAGNIESKTKVGINPRCGVW